MRQTNGNLRRHIFLPYMLAILALVSMVCIYLSFQNAHSIENENRAMLGRMLGTASEQLDTMFTELDSVSYDILQNRVLYPYSAFSSGYYTMLAANELMSYRASSAYLSDVILYYDDEAVGKYSPKVRFLTSTGGYEPNTFWNQIHPLEGWTHESFQEKVGTLFGSEILFPVRDSHRVSSQDYLLYITTAQQSRTMVNNRGCLIFMISRKYLNSLFSQITSQYQGTLTVFDREHQPLYFTSEGDGSTQTLPEDFDPSVYEAQVHPCGNGGLSVALHTPDRDYTYLLTFSQHPYPSPYLAAFLSLLPLLVLTLLFGIAGATALARSIYQPISQVSQMVPVTEEKNNETLWGIVDSVREMRDRNDEMERQIVRQRELSIVQNVRSLLYCNYTSADALLEQLYVLGLRLYSPYHIVMTGRVHAETGLAEKREQCMDAIVAMHKPCYVIPLDVKSDFAVLCGLENEQDDRQIAAAIHLQVGAVLKNGDCLSLGCSRPVADILLSHEAFRNSQESLSSLFLHGTGVLLPPPSDLQTTEVKNWYPLEQEESLRNALRQGDDQNARQITEGMAELIRQKCSSAHAARAICHNVVQHLMTALGGEGMAAPLHAVQERLNRPNETLTSIKDALISACCVICQMIRQQLASNGREKQLSERVEEYLQEKFAVSSLAMPDVAEHFGLSEGYLSRTFKAQTGGSIMQRLSAIRLEHAKRLLREEDLPLDDVIALCGYVDKSHFIRTFKKACFITPIQYRKLSREDGRAEQE